jgi:squalene synthase HpnC
LIIMKYSSQKIQSLTTPSGGEFSVASPDEAFDFCRNLAMGHYENFPVGSVLIPKKRRPHFFSVYAFARIADDIADEDIDFTKDEKLDLLDDFEDMLHGIKRFASGRGNPIFVALYQSIKEKKLPDEPFIKLLNAFRQDIRFFQPRNHEDNLKYCDKSANPVGELVLRIFDNFNEETKEYSDAICTGLQLANFWQDFSRDLNAGRCYVPKSILDENKLTINDLTSGKKIDKLDKLVYELVDQARAYLLRGKRLIKLLNSPRLRLEISLTIEGGLLILSKTEKLGHEAFTVRPKINKMDIFRLLLNSMVK